jgi:DNA recombination protein RmuC
MVVFMTIAVVALVVGLIIGLLSGLLLARKPDAPAADIPGDFARTADVMTDGLHHVFDQLQAMGQQWAAVDGKLTTDLRHTMAATQKLAETTDSLRTALASPKSRGQWGERMADDVLRVAGFVEGINYQRETTLDGGGRPDFTFNLPQNRCVHMDAKFPVDNYLRWLESDEMQQPVYAKAFAKDVRMRVTELGDRGYIDSASTVDYLLLFIPNESVYGFVHEHDPDFVDFALARKVVPVSPTSLFAVLAVMRAAVDNYRLSEAGDAVLASVGGLRAEWGKVGGAIAKMDRALLTARVAMDDLSGPRTRQFERQITKLETLGTPARDSIEGDSPDSDLNSATLRQVV